MRVLVTGAKGFVGPHLVRHLAGLGDEVVAAGPDDLDVADPSSCRKVVASAAPDVVYHLAGVSHVEGAAEETYRVNALGTSHLLDALHSEAPRARVVLASSAYVYG
ncbi:MAG TPA: NAD-dependent epimerase/dehydratase family protein, partial [Candidatus Thermoplasmatota archaeon]|nr:NAD-dependent epimerase/dehydratase family protein [Candidatus Thermoplasmatota archaeon]